MVSRARMLVEDGMFDDARGLLARAGEVLYVCVCVCVCVR